MSLIERCKQYFGTTDNPEAAGFLLPDGEMLNFDRDDPKRWRPDPEFRYEGEGKIFRAHKKIFQCIPYPHKLDDDPIAYFMKETGAVRMDNAGRDYPYWLFEANCSKELTPSQRRIMGRLCRGATCVVDVKDEERRLVKTKRYEGGLNWSEINEAWGRCKVSE